MVFWDMERGRVNVLFTLIVDKSVDKSVGVRIDDVYQMFERLKKKEMK